ncbi:MAG: ABC-F family ATP-binding cassette domain-containing protein [Segniliparus sp.]|uniref:ABC-F family ATP-binding cassette domain-containing protein n=1 Tax=Segniliparus sp. TaxID=2804064 RepID=UPI003F2E3F31
MDTTLVAKGLKAAFGARELFSDLDLVVAPGDVVGLVGVNGAGKSTLLEILAGRARPQAGTVAAHPSSALIGYLTQTHERDEALTVREFLLQRAGVGPAQEALDAAAEQLAEDPESGDHYADCLDRWLRLGGADADARLETVAAELGFQSLLDLPTSALSGGQAARTGLAALMLSRYDVYLLDEPTNDLDLDGIERLEAFVSDLRAGVVLVSHDREFLARTVTRVLELDLAQRTTKEYSGGYEAYLRERETVRRHAREQYEEYADTKAGLEERARTQRNWMEHGVRNARRKATDNDKFVKNFRADSTEKQASKVSQSMRAIERLEVVEEPRKEWELRYSIAVAPRSGNVVASLRGAVVRRGEFTLGPVDLQVDWADRIAITGANGSGKSTLLAALLGRTPVDEGEAHLGSGTVVGEIDQPREALSSPEPLIEVVGAILPDLPTADLRTLLAKFGLSAAHVLRPAATLSPGERTRAELALMQARGVNLLVLDEPTNHLDLPAIEQLESALDSYTGTLLLVTHDRRMLDAVRVNRRVEVAGGKVVDRLV